MTVERHIAVPSSKGRTLHPRDPTVGQQRQGVCADATRCGRLCGETGPPVINCRYRAAPCFSGGFGKGRSVWPKLGPVPLPPQRYDIARIAAKQGCSIPAVMTAGPRSRDGAAPGWTSAHTSLACCQPLDRGGVSPFDEGPPM